MGRRRIGVVSLAAAALAWTAPAAVVAAGPTARAAHRLTGTATAHLTLLRADGKTLFESGQVSGALSGSVRAELRTGASFTANFTISTRNGSITGHGQAKPSGEGRYRSFAGSLTVTGGTGRYAHAHGHGGLYGTVDNRTDKVVIQAVGGSIFY